MNIRQPKAFPHERVFDRFYEYGVRLLEARAAGSQPVTENPDILCPFSIPDLLDCLIERYCPENEIINLRGTLYICMKNEWYDHYTVGEELRGKHDTEGNEFMTLTVTPTNSSNKLKIDVVASVTCSTNNQMTAALFQDSTAGALAAINFYNPTNDQSGILNFSHYMTAGTTSATTFKLRVGSNTSGTVTFNGQSGSRKLGGVCASSITITEIEV